MNVLKFRAFDVKRAKTPKYVDLNILNMFAVKLNIYL
jgi:hypothetical protein